MERSKPSRETVVSCSTSPPICPEAEAEVAVVVDDDSELRAELAASAQDERAGWLVDMKDVIARLGFDSRR